MPRSWPRRSAGPDELRSLNAQIEYVLRDALRKAGRLPKPGEDTEATG